MKNWNTILLGFISVGLLAYIYWSVWEKPGSTQIQKDSRKVGLFKYDRIQRIELTNSKGEFVLTKNKNNSWEIEKPVSYPADNSVVREMLMELEMARRLDTLKNITDLESSLTQYGLKEPRIKITTKTDQDSQTISIGRLAAVPSTMYALLHRNQNKEIIVLDQDIEEFLGKDLDQWRSHDLFDFYPQLITGITLRKEQQEISIKKNSEDVWEISKPLVIRADGDSIQKFLNEVLQFKAKKFVSETDSSSPTYGLSTPSLIIEIADLKQNRILKIGSVVSDDPECVYASYGERSAVFTLPKKVLTSLDNILDIVRDRRIVSYPYTASVRQLSITYDGINYKLYRDKENIWKFSDTQQTADFPSVDSFLGQLFTTRVTRYPDAANPNIFGFNKPTATIQWSAKSLAPEQESLSKPELPEEETLVFGSISGEEIFLQTPRQPSITTVSKKILEHFPHKSWSWNSLKIFTLDAASIQSIAWEAPSASLLVEAIGTNTWKSDQGELDLDILKLQLKVLKKLEAVRWIGPPAKNDFSKPLLTLKIKHHDQTDCLIFGKELDDQNVVAMFQNDKYAFLIPQREFKTLALSPKIGTPIPDELKKESEPQ